MTDQLESLFKSYEKQALEDEDQSRQLEAEVEEFNRKGDFFVSLLARVRNEKNFQLFGCYQM